MKQTQQIHLTDFKLIWSLSYFCKNTKFVSFITSLQLTQIQMAQLHFLEKYTIEHKQENSNQIILRDKLNGNYVLMKEIQVSGHEDFKRMVEALEVQKELRHDHLLTLIDYNSTNQATSQGVKRKIVSFFEYSTHKLQDEIEVRTRQNRPFQQIQMWSIICSPVFGLSYLQKQNMGHGSVSTIDVYLTSQGLIKICDPAFASSSPFDFIEGYYYAPQLLASFTQHDVSIIDNLDIFKADVFSLAMCALHSGLLQDCSDCYVYNEGVIYQEMLETKLQRLSEYYSQDYIKVLRAMLEVDTNLRPNFIELEECLMQLLSTFGESNSMQNSFGNSKNMKYLSRITPTIDFCDPDDEDQGDCLVSKWICSTESYEHEIIDVNQDAKVTQEEVETRVFLKAASQSLISSQYQSSCRMSRNYQNDESQNRSYFNFLTPRMSKVSSASSLKSIQKYQSNKLKGESSSRNLNMIQTYSKENLNNVNLINLVKRNSKSIVIQNQIGMLQNRMSSSYLNIQSRQNLDFKRKDVRSSIALSKNSTSLFTDPVLMEVVRTDLKRIRSKPKVTFIHPEQ